MRQLQENGKDVPLLKIWCAVHRSALAWNSVCSSVAEVNYLIRDAAALATYFHSSGVRTRELHKVATENKLKVLRLPQYFEVRWSQYMHKPTSAFDSYKN
jgi:oligoribonuclease (3'-5' exoribonuclease)